MGLANRSTATRSRSSLVETRGLGRSFESPTPGGVERSALRYDAHMGDAVTRVGQLEERLRVLSETLHAFSEATGDLEQLLIEIAARMSTLLTSTCVVQLLSDDRT